MSQISCSILNIPWINPFSSESRTRISSEEIDYSIKLIEKFYRKDQKIVLKNIPNLTIDDLINRGVFVSSVIDLFLLYITHNPIHPNHLIFILVGTYYFMLMIYEELIYPYISLNSLSLRIHEENSLDLIRKYYNFMIDFVDYNTYALPLTINYITKSQECLENKLNPLNLEMFYSALNFQATRAVFYKYSPKERITMSLLDS